MRSVFLLIVLTYLPHLALSQEEERRGFYLKLDNRRTHIQGDFTAIHGIFTGFYASHNLRLKSGINGTLFSAGQTSRNDPSQIASRLFFFSLGAEYNYYENSNFVLTSYLKVGYGWHYYNHYAPEGDLVKETEPILPLELGTYLSYHFKPWIDLKVGGGWRWVFLTDDQSLSNYYLKLGTGIHFNYLKLPSRRSK